VTIVADHAALDWSVQVPPGALPHEQCDTLAGSDTVRSAESFGVAHAIIAEHGGSVSCAPLDDGCWCLHVRLPASPSH
jgi:hypothetical protein